MQGGVLSLQKEGGELIGGVLTFLGKFFFSCGYFFFSHHLLSFDEPVVFMLVLVFVLGVRGLLVRAVHAVIFVGFVCLLLVACVVSNSDHVHHCQNGKKVSTTQNLAS